MPELKKCFAVALVLTLLSCCFAPAALAAYQDGVYRDTAPGYNDEVIVTVKVRDGKLMEFSAENKSGEKSEYFMKAEEAMRSAIIEKQGLEGVDSVSGATGTSTSILTAMEGILKQAMVTMNTNVMPQDMSGGTSGAAGAVTTPRPTLDPAKAEVFSGLGSVCNFRIGPGKDETDMPVYSFNITMANALFDREGKILDVQVDIYEVSTPNYDGESMPHFSGWPNKEGYSTYDSVAGKIAGVSKNTEESATQELTDWKTKRERDDSYGMNPTNEWYKQMDNYEQWMIGKTVNEVRSWFARYTSERNGRPIKANSDNAEDKKIYAVLSDKEKQELADVVSMATMSMSDSHGLILEAIEKAYDHRTPLDGIELD